MIHSQLWFYFLTMTGNQGAVGLRKFSEAMIDTAIAWAEARDLCVVVRYGLHQGLIETPMEMGILLGTTLDHQSIAEQTAAELIPCLERFAADTEFSLRIAFSQKDDGNFFNLNDKDE